MLGVEDVFGGGYKIVSRHFSHGIALRVHPLHALAQMEGPGQAVGAGFPAFSQAGLKLPIPVGFNQRINQVRKQPKLAGGSGGQIIQCCHFAAVQGAICLFLCQRRCSGGQSQEQREQQSDKLFHQSFLLLVQFKRTVHFMRA